VNGAYALAAAVALAAVPATRPSGEATFLAAKAAFVAHERPPYVVYTLERRDRRGGMPDFENSYDLRIWCRTKDRAAVSRRMFGDRIVGPPEFLVPAFDEVVDPGPPTANMFEDALFAPPAPAATAVPDESPLPTIGGVRTVYDRQYRVTGFRRSGDQWEIDLAPRRDPQRNRIEAIWVDAATLAVRRMRVRDHLYLSFSAEVLDDEFDVRFTERDGLPMISAIHGHTPLEPYETDYTFRDVAFPRTLPDWYFHPEQYGQHRGDPPS